MGARFSFDPGSDSLGWAVFSDENGAWAPKACGTLLFRQPGLERLRTGGPAARDRGLRRARKRRMGFLRSVCHVLTALDLLPQSPDGRNLLFAGRIQASKARLAAGREIWRLARRRGAPCCGACPQGCFGSEEVQALCARRQARQKLAAIWQALQAAEGGTIRQSGHAALDGLLFGERPCAAEPKPRRGDPALRRALCAAAGLLDRLARQYGTPDSIACEAAVRVQAAGRPKGRAGRLGLWRKAARNGQAACLYTGTVISQAMALSRLTETDHVLPVAASADFSADNLVLCLASANRAKGWRTPFQAFGGTALWPGILDRNRSLPPPVAGRVAAGNKAKPSFPARQASLSAACGRGLMRLAGRRFPQAKLLTVTPSAAALHRGGLPKDRNDHRHHALDAVCAGLAAFGLVAENSVLEDLAARASVMRLQLSSRNARLHEQTVYSVRTPGKIAVRKPLCDLGKRDLANVIDGPLRRRLAAAMTDGLNRFGDVSGIRRVRIARAAADAIVLPANGIGAPVRAVLPLAHAHLDIVQMRNGQWEAFAATRHDAAQKAARPVWEAAGGGKLVMRLKRDDLIELDEGGKRVVLRVVRLAAAKSMLWLAEPQAAGNLAARHADPADPFRFQFVSASGLKARRALAVRAGLTGDFIARKSNAACLGAGTIRHG